ncbi:MAG: ornithine cyclodeaminase family protein [Marinilabiliales bacterium]
MPLILNKKDVQSVLTMKDCIQVVEKAFAELSNGTAALPLRNNISQKDNLPGLALYMPAYLQKLNALACKVVTVYKDNPVKYNMPTTIGKVLLQDPNTGDVICIMDGGYLTAVRTGAASGVANKYLAKKSPNQTISIFGTGVQAQMQLWAMLETLDVKKVMVYDLVPEASEKFAKEMSEKHKIDIIIAENAGMLLDADVICTATSSSTPLWDGKKLKPGTHINNIGSHSPGARELDTETVKRSKFVGDSKEACFNEAGDIIIPLKEGAISEDHFNAELGDLVTGKKPGRENDEEITVFKSNGLAIQDVATAKLIYDKAIESGIGINVNI